MRKVGTANIIEVMDAYDLLPTHNYKFGSHLDTVKIKSTVFMEKYLAILELIHRMSRGEGFGKTAGMGVHKMKQ